jgi:alkylation response protein AidB-like acyl-CoA dehydrogenase
MIANLIFKKLKKATPSVSQTELTALKAGDSSIESHIFTGNINWNAVLKIKHATLSEEETRFCEKETQELCDMVNDFTIDSENKDLQPEVWAFIKEKGFFSLNIKKEYGGKEFSPFAISQIVSLIASKSVVTAVTVMVPNSLGPAELLQHYGTKEQQNKYLPRLADGREIPCFALTSPESGSDATSILDEGIVCYGKFDKKEQLGIKLSWDKRYITLAPVATLIGLAFKAKDPDGLLGKTKNLGITCALIPADLPGVFNNKRHSPCGLKFMNGPTTGQSVFIPLDYVIGGPDYIGKGWMMLVDCLSAGRGVSLPALGASTNQVAYKTSLQYSRLRKQFGTEIFNFEGIKELLFEISTNNIVTEAFRKLVLTALNSGVSPTILTAMAKYHITESSRESIMHAMDIHAGKAIQCGVDNYLNFLYRGSPIAITVEGANILTRSLMIFGQGSVRCHPFLLSEFMSLSNPNEKEGLRSFKKLLHKHISYSIKKYLIAIKRNYICRNKTISNHPLSVYMTEIDRLSSGYAFVTDLLLLSTGGNVKREEHLSARLGDYLSYLTLSVSLIIDFQNNDNREQLLELYQLSLLKLLNKIDKTSKELHRNCNQKVIKSYISSFLFVKPKILSNLTDKNKDNMLTTLSGNEHSLTNLIHMDTNEECGISTVHHAYANKLRAKPLYEKIKQEVKKENLPSEAPTSLLIKIAKEAGTLNDEDVEIIQKAEKLLRKTISVQAFPMKAKEDT